MKHSFILVLDTFSPWRNCSCWCMKCTSKFDYSLFQDVVNNGSISSDLYGFVDVKLIVSAAVQLRNCLGRVQKISIESQRTNSLSEALCPSETHFVKVALRTSLLVFRWAVVLNWNCAAEVAAAFPLVKSIWMFLVSEPQFTPMRNREIPNSELNIQEEQRFWIRNIIPNSEMFLQNNILGVCKFNIW